MQNPYNERFLKALDVLQEKGAFTTLTEFCEALGFHPNYIAGFRSGKRNVQPKHLSNLFTKYRVSLHYLLIGKLPIMEPEREQPTPEQKSELERALEKERQENAFLRKMLEYREGEVRYLREVLRLEMRKDEENDS